MKKLVVHFISVSLLVTYCLRVNSDTNDSRCTLEGLTNDCSAFKQGGSKIEFSDGTYLPNLVKFRPFQHAMDDSISDELRAHVASVVKDTELRIEGLVTHGKAYEKLAAEEKTALDRLRSIKFVDDLKLKEKNLPGECSTIMPNAFYTAENHSLTLCPNFYHLPDAAIIEFLGHEMGHAIDPCNSHFEVFKINQESLAKFKFVDTQKQMKYKKVLSDLANSSTGLTTDKWRLQFEDDSLASSLKVAGALTLVALSIPAKKYIFSHVLSCLQGKGFTSANLKSTKKTISKVTEIRKEIYGPGYDAAADKKVLEATVKEFPECEGANGDSQLREALPDWIGAEVLGGYLQEHPPAISSSLDKMASVSWFLAMACRDREDKSYSAISPEAISQNAVVDTFKWREVHGLPIRRFNNIISQNPQIRKALGCSEGTGCRQSGESFSHLPFSNRSIH